MVIVRFILENLKTGILGGLPILLSYGLPRSLQLGLDEGGGHRAVLTRLNQMSGTILQYIEQNKCQ